MAIEAASFRIEVFVFTQRAIAARIVVTARPSGAVKYKNKRIFFENAIMNEPRHATTRLSTQIVALNSRTTLARQLLFVGTGPVEDRVVDVQDQAEGIMPANAHAKTSRLDVLAAKEQRKHMISGVDRLLSQLYTKSLKSNAM